MSDAPDQKPADGQSDPSDEHEEELLGEVEGEADDLEGELADMPVDEEAAAMVEGETTQEQGAAAEFDFSQVEEAPRPRKALAPKLVNPSHTVKAMGIPVLLTVGLLLLIPGFWSLLLLAGAIKNNREDARTMAFVMLMCWPIAAVLFTAAGYFYQQFRREKAVYDAAMNPQAAEQTLPEGKTPPSSNKG
jgi:hypothetical protein